VSARLIEQKQEVKAINGKIFVNYELLKNGVKRDANYVIVDDANEDKLRIRLSEKGTYKLILNAAPNHQDVVLSEFTVGDTDVIDGIFNFKDEDGFAVSFSKTYVYETAIDVPLLGTSDIGIGELKLVPTSGNSNNDRKMIPESLPIIGTRDKFKDSCLERQMSYHASQNGKPSDKANLYKAVIEWYYNAQKTSAEVSSQGVAGYLGLNAGGITSDLERLLPKIEQDPGTSTSFIAAQGYCDSLAEHIVRYDDRGADRGSLFRLFESQNHRSGANSADYKVFWLNRPQLKHILEDHGPLSTKVPRANVPKSRFSDKSQIVPMIESSILNSGSSNRGADRNNISATSFQTKFSDNEWYSYNENNQANTKDSTDIMLIWSLYEDSVKNKINTAFPLVPSAFEQYTIPGGPRP
jgi:hypothetical protein